MPHGKRSNHGTRSPSKDHQTSQRDIEGRHTDQKNLGDKKGVRTRRQIHQARVQQYANSLRNTLQWTLAALIIESEKSQKLSENTKAAITAARKELTRITPEKLNRI